MLFASGQLLKICGTLRLPRSSTAPLPLVCARLAPISTASGMLLAQERSLVNVPETISVRLTDAYLQTDVDVEHEVQSAGGAGSRIISDRTLVEPTLGVGTAVWAYHPNLLEYTTQTAFGLGYQEARVTPGSAATDTQFLERYHVALDVLKRKPGHQPPFPPQAECRSGIPLRAGCVGQLAGLADARGHP